MRETEERDKQRERDNEENVTIEMVKMGKRVARRSKWNTGRKMAMCVIMEITVNERGLLMLIFCFTCFFFFLND